MAWTKLLFQLRDALATQIPFRDDALPYLTEAHINWQAITLPNNANTLWYNILSFTDNNAKTDELVEVLLVHFPDNPHLLSFKENLNYSLGPELKNPADWKGTIATKALEKMTGDSNTLLPISFLEKGLKKARSVARVLIKKNTGTEAGTGFLIDKNLFITNNHVISDQATAQIALIQFNYEESLSGLAIQPTEFTLDPANGFATSAATDWTCIRIKGDANTEFGAIELKPATVSKSDFVNIIQHPGGRYKQIGMYHNIVTYSDDDIVQYLTDTEPGSSGSPVFNSQWEVVALHHSGGMLREPGTSQTLLRNEGININKVISEIKAANL
jgi:V8-like Glu-specific endopeptidase